MKSPRIPYQQWTQLRLSVENKEAFCEMKWGFHYLPGAAYEKSLVKRLQKPRRARRHCRDSNTN